MADSNIERAKWTREQVIEYNSQNYFGNNSFSGADMVAVMHITNVDGINGTYTLGSLQTLSYSTSMQRAPIRSIGNVNAKDYVMGPRTIAGSLVFAVFDKHFVYEAMKAIRGITEEDYHFLADELPPFDITITFANEYGKMAKLAIYGVRLVNEGQVMSINDIYTENTYQYVATDIDYLSDQTTNTSGQIYTPLKPNPNSVSNPVVIEDIVIEEPKEQDDDISRYQVVTVKTIDAYVEDGIVYNGKASFDLFKRVEYGQLVVNYINSDTETRYDLTQGIQYPIIADDLEPGEYTVCYYSGISYSKITRFTINNKRSETPVPEKPIIVIEEKTPDNLFTVGIQATDNNTKGIQYTETPEVDKSWKNIEPINPYSIIKGLKEYHTYYFRSFNDGGVSTYISCYTDAKKEHLFSDFEKYLESNKYYLQAEWSYIQTMMNLAYDKWLITPTFSICASLEAIKSQLDLTDINRKRAYDRLCAIAAEYEQNHKEYASQGAKINVPKIINAGMAQLEFDKNVTSLVIKPVSKPGYTKHVPRGQFQDYSNSKYRYVITSKYTGMHDVYACGPDGLRSPSLSVNVPERNFALELIEEKRASDIILEQQLTAAAIKGLNSQEALNTPEQKKELLLKEINNNAQVVKQGISDPLIIYMNDSEINVSCNIPLIAQKQYYLCLSPTEKIGTTALKERVLISSQMFNYTFYKSKHALIQNKRYSLWIEDSNNKIVSNTTSFDFNSEQSYTGELKNAEIIAIVKESYGYRFNKDKVDDFKDDALLSEGKVFNSIIVSNMIDIASNDKNKMNYLYDSIMAKHKRNNVTPSTTKVSYMKLNVDKYTLTGDFKYAGYTTAILVQYDSKGNVASHAYKVLNDNAFYLDNLNMSHYKYGYIYLTNDSCSKVSEIILLNYDTKQYLTNFELGVKW